MKNSIKDGLTILVGITGILCLSIIVSLFVSGCGKKQALKPVPEVREEIKVIFPDMPPLPIEKECPEFPPDMPPFPEMVEKSDFEMDLIDSEFLKKQEIVIYLVGTWEIEKDCLWNIAEIIYADPFLWTKIYNANKDKINDPALIYPGQHLICPMD